MARAANMVLIAIVLVAAVPLLDTNNMLPYAKSRSCLVCQL